MTIALILSIFSFLFAYLLTMSWIILYTRIYTKHIYSIEHTITMWNYNFKLIRVLPFLVYAALIFYIVFFCCVFVLVTKNPEIYVLSNNSLSDMNRVMSYN